MGQTTMMNLVKSPSRSKSEETRERILQTALGLFRERGFEKTTMREVASRAGVALGAAYYYFDAKESIILAFYDQAQREVEPRIEEALSTSKDLRERLSLLLRVKFESFAPNRGLLLALAGHTNPENKLSPFSAETRNIREKDVRFFERAIAGSGTKIPEDLNRFLPRVLWFYQMGLILFWIHDRSPEQKKTKILLDKSLSLIVGLVKLSGVTLVAPLRKQAVELLETMLNHQEEAEPALRG